MSSDAASISELALRRDAKAGPRAFLSSSVAEGAQRRLALAVVVISVAIFAIAAPFAKTPLAAVPAFLPIYQSALVINDLVTAVLLFGQFAILRSRALMVLASAYLFSAAMAVAHLLSFPGLFAPGGLFGAGPQTTAWLYFLWHGGFPLLVIAYALLKDVPEAEAQPAGGQGVGLQIALSIAAVVGAACLLMLATTAGHGSWPEIMRGDRDASTKIAVAACCWLLSLAALTVLWRRRPHSLVDTWLMVTLCVWIFDIALASVLNGGRYDLGWYAGRVYGLLAASFVMLVLLLENSVLHARIAAARESERSGAQAAYERHEERLRILHQIDRSIVGERPVHEIAGAVIQPLRVLLGVPRAIVNMFDVAAGEVEWLAAAGRSRTHVGPGVRYSIRIMGDLEALQRGENQIVHTRRLPDGKEKDALLSSGVEHYMVVPMIAGGRLMGAISFGGEQDSFAPERVSIAREVATQLAIAINQASLIERLRQHADTLEQRVNERTAELLATNRELEAFSYSVSHDLRSPLRAIGGFNQILAEDYGPGLDDEGRRLLGVIRDSTVAMERLIDDLLKFARAGRAPLAMSALEMDSLVRGVVSDLAQAYPGARIEQASLPPAQGDAALVKQVWTNLVANALKYSSRSAGPRIEIGGSADGAECRYWVRDNGAGFDMRYAEKLFKVFQRLHGPEEFEGTGVGLAIVQRVVTRHGGRVWAEGKRGEGACFHFTLRRDA